MSLFKTLSHFSLLATVCFCSITQASSIFFEPSVGYKSHTLRLTDYANSETKLTMVSPVYGLRVGTRSMMGIDLNLAYDYSAGKADYSPLSEKNNFSQKTASAQLGINALGALKIYLGYGFLNELQVDGGILNSDMKLKGLAYQAGLQFKLIPLVMFGLQYNLNQFKTIEGKIYRAGNAIDTYYNKVDSQDFSGSLSISF